MLKVGEGERYDTLGGVDVGQPSPSNNPLDVHPTWEYIQ